MVYAAIKWLIFECKRSNGFSELFMKTQTYQLKKRVYSYFFKRFSALEHCSRTGNFKICQIVWWT